MENFLDSDNYWIKNLKMKIVINMDISLDFYMNYKWI